MKSIICSGIQVTFTALVYLCCPFEKIYLTETREGGIVWLLVADISTPRPHNLVPFCWSSNEAGHGSIRSTEQRPLQVVDRKHKKDS